MCVCVCVFVYRRCWAGLQTEPELRQSEAAAGSLDPPDLRTASTRSHTPLLTAETHTHTHTHTQDWLMIDGDKLIWSSSLWERCLTAWLKTAWRLSTMCAGPWATVPVTAPCRTTKVMAVRALSTASRTQSLRVTTRGSSCSCQEEAEEEDGEAGGDGPVHHHSYKCNPVSVVLKVHLKFWLNTAVFTLYKVSPVFWEFVSPVVSCCSDDVISCGWSSRPCSRSPMAMMQLRLMATFAHALSYTNTPVLIWQ